jgi:tryptophan synthase alpha subunit
MPVLQHAIMPDSRLSIRGTFRKLKERQRTALMPFVAGGYPDMPSVAATLPALEQAGASLIEIGFPFSDPIADGPTIQAAFTEALSKGIRLKDVFDLVRGVRSAVSIPLVAMVTYSIVYRYGVEKFVAEAKSAGFDGLILPDTNVQAMREFGDTPICVGFGIHRPEQVAQLAGVADGAIVGSALVKRMREAHPGGPSAVAAAASSYCRELLRLVR